jgi:hypothetical protein
MEWAENCAFCTGIRFGVVDTVHKERKPDYVGKENEFLLKDQRLVSHVMSNLCTHLSHICANLANLCEELNCCHPLISRKSGFACEIVYMRHQTLHEVFQSWIGTSRIDQVNVFRDVLNSKVLERRNFDL